MEKALSICFIPNDYLLISTNINNYHVNLDENRLFSKQTTDGSKLEKISEEDNAEAEDAIKYMTTSSNNQNT